MRNRRGDLEDRVTTACRTYHNAIDEVDEAVCAHEGINRTDLRCLDVLHLRGPLSAGELAHACGLTTGALTALLDRLERVGYVERTRTPTDRRKVVVKLTDAVVEKAEALYGPLAAANAELLRSYSDEELELIARFLHDGRALNLAQAERLRSGG